MARFFRALGTVASFVLFISLASCEKRASPAPLTPAQRLFTSEGIGDVDFVRAQLDAGTDPNLQNTALSNQDALFCFAHGNAATKLVFTEHYAKSQALRNSGEN